VVIDANGADQLATRCQGSGPGIVAKATLILDAFCDAPHRLLLDDVSEITGLPRSTAFRILRQLVTLHWLEHGPRGYWLGPRMTSRVVRGVDRDEIRAAASVPLTDLHVATGAVSHLSVLDGGVTYYLDKIGGSLSGSVPSRVGARIVASDTVSGRAMLACMTPEQVDAAIGSSRSLTNIETEALHRELWFVRERGGIAVAPGADRPSGISSIAAAIVGPDGPVAAISVARKGELHLETVGPLVAYAARRTSAGLFPRSHRRGVATTQTARRP
jgi:DNA-binding IclR family transcriptional regulator